MAQTKKPYGKKDFAKAGKDTKGNKPMKRNPKGTKRKSGSDKYEGEPANDPRYYATHPIMTALTTAIPVSPVLGTEAVWGKNLNITSAPGLNTTFPIYGERIPGMMGISMIPAFGSDMGSGYADSASFNRLCANLYSNMVKDKSGTAPFDQAAVGQYIVALRSAYIVVHDLKRFIDTVTHFQSGNRYFPKGIGYAIGRANYMLSASEIDAVKWEVNKLIRFLNTKYVPKMPIFSRDYDLYSRYYADSQTEYAQFYAFYPRGFYLWDDANNVNTWVPFGTLSQPDLPSTLPLISALVDNIIGSMQNSDMFNIITAWFRHAYDAGTSWLLEEIGLNSQPVFVYDEYVLAQIENMRTVRHDYSAAGATNLDIVQVGANNYLEYRDINTALGSVSTRYNIGLSQDPTFNFHVTVPTEELKLEASRLCVAAREEQLTFSGSGDYANSVLADFIFSDQIPVICTIAFAGASNGAFGTANMWTQDNALAGNHVTPGFIERELGFLSNFKSHPLFWEWEVTPNAGGTEIDHMIVGVIGDIDTPAALDKNAFNRMSYTCTYSLFSLPGSTV